MHHHVALARLKLLCVAQAAHKHAEIYLPLPFEQYSACFILLLTWLFSTRHQQLSPEIKIFRFKI